MGKPRGKGMRKGYLKRFSSQSINAGRYAPHKPTLAEYSRRSRSLGNVNPKTLHITQPQPMPPSKGSSPPRRERTEKLHNYWSIFVRNERHQIKPDEFHVKEEYDGRFNLYRLIYCGVLGWFWYHLDKETKIHRRSEIYPNELRARRKFPDRIHWEKGQPHDN